MFRLTRELAVQVESDQSELDVLSRGSRAQFEEFINRMLSDFHQIDDDSLSQFLPKLSNDVVLALMSTEKLRNLAARVGLPHHVGSRGYLRLSLLRHWNALAEDDKLIIEEGVDVMCEEDVCAACEARGLGPPASSVSHLREQLRVWSSLSVHNRVCIGALILSQEYH